MSKKNKKRQCPALDTVIDSADCGANRHSKYTCPASCQFSPYNPDNYGQLLEIEEKVDNILFKRGIDHPYFEKQLAEALHRNGKEEFKLTGNFVNTLHREVDEAGETLFESWEKARYKGLKNDEIVLLGYKNSMRISVIEIQRIIDHQTVIVQDLLDETSQPRKMVDRSLSARACRFQTLLAYIYSTPDFDRIHGAAYLIPDISGISAVETLKEIVQHVGGAHSQEWLMANTDKIIDAWDATSMERHRRFMLNSQIKSFEVEYSLSASPAAVASKLLEAGLHECDLGLEDSQEGVTHIFEALDFDSEAATPSVKGSAQVLGSIKISLGKASIFAMSSAGMDRIRQILESTLGDKAVFSKEMVQDLSRQIADRDPGVDLSLIPPRLLGNEGGMALSTSYVETPFSGSDEDDSVESYFRSYYKNLLDSEIPELDDLTPRQAAKDPKARPRLVLWAKRMICNNDKLNLEKGEFLDLDWVLLELGLDEIVFPRPLSRPKPKISRKPPDHSGPDSQAEEDIYSGGSDEDDDFDGDLDIAQVDIYSEAIAEWVGTFQSPKDGYREMRSSGCNLMQAFTDEAGEIFTGAIREICKFLFPMIWFTQTDEFEVIRLKPGTVSKFMHEFYCDIAELSEEGWHDTGDYFFDLCEDPELFATISEIIMKRQNIVEKKMQLSKKEKANLAICLIVAINAYWDEVMRS